MRETKQQRAKRQAFERKVFCSVLRAAGNTVVEEHRFYAKRRWRFDIALPDCWGYFKSHPSAARYECRQIAVEIEGLGGRHQTTVGFVKDLEKYRRAFELGWWLLRVTTKEIADGTALDALARAGVRVASVRGKTYPVEG